MSLINDALRRAKQDGKGESQESSTGAPMEPVQSPDGNPSKFASMKFLIVFVFILLAGGFLFWKGTQKKIPANIDSGEPSKIVSISANPTTPVPEPVVTSVIEPPKKSANELANSVTPERTSNVTEVITAVAIPAPSSPPQLKLQGIFYRLNNSTALINGKTVGVGQIISGVRVLKIDRQSVTLEWSGQTNILTME
ncbi:MAG: hypothetical protein ABIP71_02075 [Verrucomicrobiota bacterium]